MFNINPYHAPFPLHRGKHRWWVYLSHPFGGEISVRLSIIRSVFILPHYKPVKDSVWQGKDAADIHLPYWVYARKCHSRCWGANTNSPSNIRSVTHQTPTSLWHPQLQSTNDVAEVLSVKNLPENGALWCRNCRICFTSRKRGWSSVRRAAPTHLQHNGKSTELVKKTGRFTQFQQRQKVQIYRRDLLQQPGSSLGSSRASRWRSAPRPHAHVRVHTHTLGTKSRRHPFPHVGVRKTASK